MVVCVFVLLTLMQSSYAFGFSLFVGEIMKLFRCGSRAG